MNKQAIICSLIGVAVGLIGLWGGAYAYHCLLGTWAALPSLATALVVIVAGVILTFFGIAESSDP